MLTPKQIASQITLHATAGGIISVLNGGEFGHGFISAGFTKGIGTPILDVTGADIVTGTIASMVIGGTASELSGGKFRNGALTAAFQTLYNHFYQQKNKKSFQKTITKSYYYHTDSGEMMHYYVLDTMLCDTSSCNPDDVFADLNINSIPFTSDYHDGHHVLFGLPFDPAWAPDWMTPNPITHTSDAVARTSTNIAHPSHIFDGYVRHSVTVTSNGKVRVTTIGAGPAENIYHASFNNMVGIFGFMGTHNQLKLKY